MSPTTAALWMSEPLRCTTPSTITWPFSTYFLALSQAPPVLEDEMAIWMEETIAPASMPATASTPRKMPNARGVVITKMAGGTISRSTRRWRWRCSARGRGGRAALQQAGDLAELARHFLDHLVRGLAHGLHGHGGEPVGDHRAEDERREDERVTRLTSVSARPERVTNAPKSARPTRHADPMAKPLPMAAVVLPAASSASVTSRTFSGSSTSPRCRPRCRRWGRTRRWRGRWRGWRACPARRARRRTCRRARRRCRPRWRAAKRAGWRTCTRARGRR